MKMHMLSLYRKLCKPTTTHTFDVIQVSFLFRNTSSTPIVNELARPYDDRVALFPYPYRTKREKVRDTHPIFPFSFSHPFLTPYLSFLQQNHSISAYHIYRRSTIKHFFPLQRVLFRERNTSYLPTWMID